MSADITEHRMWVAAYPDLAAAAARMWLIRARGGFTFDLWLRKSCRDAPVITQEEAMKP